MAGRQKVRGLDTLRFVAAAIVALSHGAAFPLTETIGKGAGWVRAATAFYGVSFDGAAAVIVFFVISGFCIHHGEATGAPFRLWRFWLRRGLRILPPLAAALAVASVLGAPAKAGLNAVLWSVYCELVYYALYPLLRVAFRKAGVIVVLIVSSLVSAAVIGLGWHAPFYWSYTVWLAWLVAAPAWLLGCLLAEQVAARDPSTGPSHVWAWRLAVWAYSASATALFFHSPIKVGYPTLLFPFQVVAYLWIFAEIRHANHHVGSRVLEWCGRWSYSLYLVHNVAIALTPLSPTALVGTWALRLAAVFGGALAFYAVIEAPSHQLARKVSRRLDEGRRNNAAAAPALAPSWHA